MRRGLRAFVNALAALVALPLLVVAALVARVETKQRQRRAERPRVVLGPTPIIASKYICESLRARGLEARTVVHEVYSINQRDDFDVVGVDFTRSRWLPVALRRRMNAAFGPYLLFASLLRRFDVFQTYFDGGFLVRTPLRFREAALLHLAGKKMVAMPYGSDVAVPSVMRSLTWRQGLMTHYPELGRRERETRRWIDHLSRHADFIVACLVHFETLPRWDLLTTLYYPIDTASWRPTGVYSDADGRSASVVVVHASNHRALKGTAYLMEACRELVEEGLRIELRLLERLPNSEVRRAMADADIVADQFILGFALAALEGMSLGRPVLSNLSEPGYYEEFRRTTGLDNCPIVNSPPERLKANLRRLVQDPALRREIGAAGRRYVEAYHAYEPVGRMWEAVYEQIWLGRRLGVAAWDPGQSVDSP